MQEGEDELNGFISPTVYISRYVPKGKCKCGVRDWGRVSTFYADGKMWKGYTICRSCVEKHFWKINPDKPIAWQGVLSNRPMVEPDDQ